ncbi:hypothetical protein A2634_04530 [Candidatus Amesbacteria bacterium RIFCSPHIGHO2_01_FULL_48_32]|uniref:VWFA domain-containing protein n=1 Tax=Candidatus Amesbacteria bacterium RIFCSPLOWO2_01_FULL_48_25 TaxID=1797259 RepID=A0A1F4ZDM7_9BACT|nr:MAG: hypothetical protein A2634_04530 [Candidatus Amesbacteria bacterium RIFCSPHIGHO2_01_FULL_48_32]OGD03807.1 MAG: hypothetical protein A2989_04000 [Candidatus Amesbacteria bacterium RIFCSPLOWO2_01_FULL_48_25]
MFIGIFLVAVMQSQFLLAVYRGQSGADRVVSGYKAESAVYDIVAKFLGGYPQAFAFPFSTSKTLDDGTTLTVEGVTEGMGQKLLVTADREYAMTRLEMSRGVREVQTLPVEAQVVLALDCSARMDEQADPTCVTGCGKRIVEEKNGTLQFINSVISRPVNARFKLGVAVFRVGAAWLIEPTYDMNAVKDAVHDGLRQDTASSPACQSLSGEPGEVSLGSGLSFSLESLKDSAGEGMAQAVVLVSGEQTNSRIPYDPCPPSVLCTGAGCRPAALEMLKCTAADDADSKNTGYLGVRGQKVSLYAVGVGGGTETEEEMMLRLYANKYFHTANATVLPRLLQEVFGLEVNRVATMKIRKVVPVIIP